MFFVHWGLHPTGEFIAALNSEFILDLQVSGFTVSSLVFIYSSEKKFKYTQILKQTSPAVLRKRCSENMQQIYRRTPMAKCSFTKVAKLLYWNHTTTWVFSCRFAAYFQSTFFQEHHCSAASTNSVNNMSPVNRWSFLFFGGGFLLFLIIPYTTDKKVTSNFVLGKP